MEQDIRWEQRLSNFKKALQKLERAIEIIHRNQTGNGFSLGEVTNDKSFHLTYVQAVSKYSLQAFSLREEDCTISQGVALGCVISGLRPGGLSN